MTLASIWRAITKPIRAAWAYQMGGYMVVPNTTGPSDGYQPPAIGSKLGDDTQVLSVQEQELDEARKIDPDPQIAPGMK